MAAGLEHRMDIIEERTDTLEAVLGQFIVSTNTALLRMERSMSEFRQEMRDFKQEMRDFKNEAERDRKQMNKKWGELSNKLGTFAEDIVAPNISRIAEEQFHAGPPDQFTVRTVRRHRDEPGRTREFDANLVTKDIFILNETKSTPRPEYVKEFIALLNEIDVWFPEYADRRLIPIFSSLYLPENIITQLTRNGIYALAMKDDTMELLNYNDLEDDRRV